MVTAKKITTKTKSAAVAEVFRQITFRSRAESLQAGKTIREKVPRSIHAGWKEPANRRDPIDIWKNRIRIACRPVS